MATYAARVEAVSPLPAGHAKRVFVTRVRTVPSRGKKFHNKHDLARKLSGGNKNTTKIDPISCSKGKLLLSEFANSLSHLVPEL